MIDLLRQKLHQIARLPEERQRELAPVIAALAEKGAVVPTPASPETEFPDGFWDGLPSHMKVGLVPRNVFADESAPTAELAVSMDLIAAASEERQASVAAFLADLIEQECWDIVPTPELLESLRKGEEDIAAGRVVSYADANEFVADILGRSESRARAKAAGLTDEDIDRLIKQAQSEVGPADDR